MELIKMNLQELNSISMDVSSILIDGVEHYKVIDVITQELAEQHDVQPHFICVKEDMTVLQTGEMQQFSTEELEKLELSFEEVLEADRVTLYKEQVMYTR